MISEFTVTYSWWWILLVLFAGLIYGLILYYKNPLSRFSKIKTILLFVFRFLSVSFLAFLLMSPYVKSKSKILEKPIVVVGIDNSQSIVLTHDSLYYKSKFIKQIKELITELNKSYKTDNYLFGETIKPVYNPDFSGQFSDYSSFLRFLKSEYKGMNLGAVIIAGDGIYNKGSDPSFEASSLPWPIYTIALGDTNSYSDIKINNIRYNDIVYMNDEFPIEINVTAEKLKNKQASLKVVAFGKKVFEKSFYINKTLYEKTFRVMIPASEKGKHSIKIELSGFKNEFNKYNNIKNIYVNILDTKKKILLIAASPHPDISAIRSSLEHYKNYKIDVKYENNTNIPLKDYNLIILHQIPSIHNNKALLDKIKNSKIPVLFILGKKSSIDKFNNFAGGMKIKSAKGFEDAQVVVNPLFSLFTYSQENAAILEKLPPLLVPFGNYIAPPFSQQFAFQKINNIETSIPLILFYSTNDTKFGVIAGEGIWLWRMHNYLISQNFDAFESLITKSVQYLLAREDKRHFKVFCKENYYPGEKIIFNAQLYNDTWELINQPEVNFILTDEQGKKFKYSFSSYEDYYLLNIDNLPSGIYKYDAFVKLGNKSYNDKGEFVVLPISLENRNLKANHKTMFNMSSETGGKMFYTNEIINIPQTLTNNNSLKTRVIYSYKTDGLNNIFSILLIIVFLLVMEWFLRKYFGSY